MNATSAASRSPMSERDATHALVRAYQEVVSPLVAMGIRTREQCFVMSCAGAEVLRLLGVDATASGVDVVFDDNRNRLSGSTSLAHADLAESGAAEREMLGHAVIFTRRYLVDLTFAQFDRFGVAPPQLVVRLDEGPQDAPIEVSAPDASWRAVYTARDVSELLTDAEAGLAGADDGLVDALFHVAAGGRVEHDRRVKVGRNEPCPCGSGAKSKRCCGA